MGEIERRLDVAEENIRELFREVKDLDGTRRETKVVLENLNSTMQELKEAVKGLAGRPGSWWDRIIQALITALVAGGVAALIGGLK